MLKATKDKLDDPANIDILKSARASLAGLKPKQERTEASYQAVKAEVDSKTSLLNIALENGDSEACRNLQEAARRAE